MPSESDRLGRDCASGLGYFTYNELGRPEARRRLTSLNGSSSQVAAETRSVSDNEPPHWSGAPLSFVGPKTGDKGEAFSRADGPELIAPHAVGLDGITSGEQSVGLRE